MKAKLLFCLAFGLASCYKPAKKVEIKPDPVFTEPAQREPLKNSKIFAFEDFVIDKGRLGPITIGITIDQAEKHLAGLVKQEVSPLDFGVDGGGEAYMYSREEEPVLALIPAMDTDTILFIAAIHKKLKTSNGLNANATVQDILKTYPGMKVRVNQITLWEYMWDKDKEWSFDFMTDEQNQIGKYADIEDSSEPLRKDIKADWILIR